MIDVHQWRHKPPQTADLKRPEDINLAALKTSPCLHHFNFPPCGKPGVLIYATWQGKPIHLSLVYLVWSGSPDTSKCVGRGRPHATASWQLHQTKTHPSHNAHQDAVSQPHGSSWKHANFMLISAVFDNEANRRPASFFCLCQFSSNSYSTQALALFFLFFFFLSFSSVASSGWIYSIIHTLQQLKHQQGKGKNMYIIHSRPPGRKAVRANERLKLWSHGALSEVNGMN